MDLNKNTVSKAVLSCSQIFDELGVSPAERCAIIANLLIVGALDSNGKIVRHPDVQPNDAFAVERALLQHGEDYFLSSVLQGHVLLQWAKNLELPE